MSIERPRFRYRYYGPGDDLRFVAMAVIDKLGFPPRRFYAPKKRRKTRREEPPSVADRTGTLATRDDGGIL